MGVMETQPVTTQSRGGEGRNTFTEPCYGNGRPGSEGRAFYSYRVCQQGEEPALRYTGDAFLPSPL